MTREAYDYVLVGGGLQNGLLGLAILSRQPQARVALVERSPEPCGNHTWCFHGQDVPPEARDLVDPLVSHRWEGYEVRFPNRRRRLDSAYACIPSSRLAERLRALGQEGRFSLVLNGTATRVGEREVALADGRVLRGRAVVDARGPDRLQGATRTGYQKFFGLEVELREPHGVDVPILMDAKVRQEGGYRFLYTLPLGPRRLLLEDTRFSRERDLDHDRARIWLLAKAQTEGYDVTRVVREESGVLPMPWEYEPVAPNGGPLRAGYGGGWFHPGTGYSFPVALRLALAVADSRPEDLCGARVQRLFEEHRKQMRFGLFLNGMLFRFFAPEQMWNAFERFYGFPQPMIDRFYAMRSTAADRARFMAGRPPKGISLKEALVAMRHAP